MKSIIQSIKPQYCELIASGNKTIEVRKTRPKLQTPFKVYIYCTKDGLLTKSHNNGNIYLSKNKYKSALEKAGNVTLSGKVIGEYVCDKIAPIVYKMKGKPLYGWHISDLKIYDKPKELGEFEHLCLGDCDVCRYSFLEEGGYFYSEPKLRCDNTIKHPPQSWCYVEEV